MIGSSVAYAAIPDGDDGEFHVCIQTNRSVNTQYTMYVIDPDAQTAFNGGCNTGYTHHVLNQQGPVGPAGPAAEATHVKVIKKNVLSGANGGQFGDTWACPSGYIATAVTWKVSPSGLQALSDVDVLVTDSRVNPLENNAAEFRFMANSRSLSGTSGQVSVEVRGTCISEVVSDGVATS